MILELIDLFGVGRHQSINLFMAAFELSQTCKGVVHFLVNPRN